MKINDVKGIIIAENHRFGKTVFKKRVKYPSFINGWIVAIIPKQRRRKTR